MTAPSGRRGSDPNAWRAALALRRSIRAICPEGIDRKASRLPKNCPSTNTDGVPRRSRRNGVQFSNCTTSYADAADVSFSTSLARTLFIMYGADDQGAALVERALLAHAVTEARRVTAMATSKILNLRIRFSAGIDVETGGRSD